jgi:hypothetical protein
MAKKFTETRQAAVIYFKDIYTNPGVETEDKEAQY